MQPSARSRRGTATSWPSLARHGDLQVEVRSLDFGWFACLGFGTIPGVARRRRDPHAENLPDWHGRSRPLSTSRRRVSRHWRPPPGAKPIEPWFEDEPEDDDN